VRLSTGKTKEEKLRQKEQQEESLGLADGFRAWSRTYEGVIERRYEEKS
jgi:hypothetical protein